MAFHSTHRKGYQNKLLFFHSKGGRCSFWSLLHCDDRRSLWWASRDGPQHDHIRSATVMICMNFNSYTSLVIFFAIPVLFCFVFQHKTLYTIRVLANFAWKPLKLALSILLSIWGFSSLLTFYNVNYSAWYVYKTLFGSSVATCRLECSEISLSIIEK